jgi:FAD-linked sulfhydryl oxidase
MIRTTDFRGRFVVLALAVFAICALLLYQAPLSHLSHPQQPGQQQSHTSGAVLTGHAIAPKLGNATAKYVHRDPCEQLYLFGRGRKRASLTCLDRAELGRAAWKVLHTTFARFPEKPTDDEKEALRSYVYLFQRLYPWYVCAMRRRS